MGLKLKKHQLGRIFTLCAIVFIATFVFIPYVGFDGASARQADIEVQIGIDVIDLSLDIGSDAGSVTFTDITPTSDGTFLIAKKDITVNTNATWYAVYLSTSSSDTTLCPRAASGACSSTSKILSNSTQGATYSSPMTFKSSSMANTWGFALAEYGSSSSSSWVDSFSSAATYAMDTEYYTTTDTTYSAYKSGYYAPVPTKGSDQKIWHDSLSSSEVSTYPKAFSAGNNNDIIVCDGTNASTCNSKGPGQFTIYYAAKITNSLMMGDYTNTVVYTAIAAMSDITASKESAYMTPTFGSDDDTVDITVNMTSTADITSDEVKVYYVDHEMYSSHFSGTVTDARLAQFGALCTDPTVETGLIGSSGVQITCTVPSIGTALGTNNTDGAPYNIVTANTQTYDIIVRMPAYNITFTTYNASSVGFRYAGMNDKDSDGNYYVKYMQDMTTGVCELTDTWSTGQWTASTWTGASAPSTIDTFSTTDAFFGTSNGSSYIKTVARNYDAPYTTVAEGGTLTNGQQWEKYMVEHYQRLLVDSRDGRSYVVRKLADGNCWMTQNLDLELYDNVKLTSTDTDLNSRDSWTPQSLSSTWIANHTYSGSSTKGTVMITQTGSEYGSSYTWAQTGNDGPHVYDQGATYYTPSLPTVTRDSSTQAITAGAPTASGTTVTYSTVANYGNPTNCVASTVSGTHYSNQQECQTATTDGIMTAYGQDFYGVNASGNYYNWYAATAGTGTATLTGTGSYEISYKMNSTGTDYELDDEGNKIVMTGDSSNPAYCGKTMTDEYGNSYDNALCTAVAGKASDSVCPRGWKLAEYSGDGSYYNLMSTYNLTSNDAGIQSAPLSLVRAGYYGYNDGNLHYRGSYGRYWESLVYSSAYARYLYFYSTYLSPQYYHSKGNGFSLRCVVR